MLTKQLVDLMHGEIKLTSELGRGTKATFWIPFNKPQFRNGGSPLVDLGSIPDRLQSEMSVSGCASDRLSGSGTPPMSPAADSLGLSIPHRKSRTGSGLGTSPSRENSDPEQSPLELDRKSIHVLVVEDK